MEWKPQSILTELNETTQPKKITTTKGKTAKLYPIFESQNMYLLGGLRATRITSVLVVLKCIKGSRLSHPRRMHLNTIFFRFVMYFMVVLCWQFFTDLSHKEKSDTKSKFRS